MYENESGFYKQNNWILWRKPNGKIGVSPDRGGADTEKEIVMRVQGDFDKACRYAESIENGVATQLSIFDFLPPEEPADEEKRNKKVSCGYHRMTDSEKLSPSTTSTNKSGRSNNLRRF